MKQFFTLISNLLIFLAFDLAHRRPKPLKIMVFFSHFDYFWEELSKLTIQNEGQNCHTSLWLQCKTSRKVINIFFFTVLSQNNDLSRYFIFNNPQALILKLWSPKNLEKMRENRHFISFHFGDSDGLNFARGKFPIMLRI